MQRHPSGEIFMKKDIKFSKNKQSMVLDDCPGEFLIFGIQKYLVAA
jgi:hypothetical protein